MTVVALGLLTLDIIHTVDRAPKPNEKVRSRSTIVTCGGPAANAAAAARALGSEAVLLSRWGDDVASAAALEELDALHVTTNRLTTNMAVPVASAVVVESTGERSVVSPYSLDTSNVNLEEDLPPGRVLLLDGHYLQAAISAATIARSRGMTVILDGGSWKPGLERLLPLVDVAILSADFRTETGELDCPFIAVTHGNQPIEIVAPMPGEIPVPAVTSINTLGAGDVFHGAFAHYCAQAGRCDQDLFPELLRQAAEVASQYCATESMRIIHPGTVMDADHH